MSNFCILQVAFFSFKFVGIVFVSSWYDSVTSLHAISKSSVILANYFQFSLPHVAGFQI